VKSIIKDLQYNLQFWLASNASILVLNTYTGSHSYIFDWTGNVDTLETLGLFEFEKKSEVHQSCSVIHKGEMIVIGGEWHTRSVSIVKDCGLRHVDDLTFDFNFGSCVNIDRADHDPFIFLCFPQYSERSCWR